MANSTLVNASRNQRRSLLKNEQRSRASGEWGEWERLEFPAGVPGDGWCKLVRQAWRNKVFAVLVRPEANGIKHLAVSSLTGTRPTWWEMQRIKNEIAGEPATAVEVYPPQSEIVDGADMFHLWVMPSALPFSLYGASR